MNIVFEAIGIVAQTFFSLFPKLLVGVFGIKDAFDGVKDQILAAILGVSVGTLAVIGIVIVIIKRFVRRIG